MKFKVGDRIRRIRLDFMNNEYPMMVHNAIFTVREVDGSSIYVRECGGRWSKCYFELAVMSPIYTDLMEVLNGS